MARVRVDDLQEGMEVASDVLSNTGQVLVRSGTSLSGREIRLFNMWGISDIEIEGDDGELAEAVPTLDPALVAKFEPQAKDLFRHAKIDHPMMAPLFRECVARLARAGASGGTPPAPSGGERPPAGAASAPPSRSIAELIESSSNMASLPSIYIRLTEVMNDPRSSTADFGAVVSDDPGLTARLLRLVNSAFYGFPSKIESVTQALSVVGTSQLNDLALATSVLRVFKGVPKEFVDMDSFWRHSLACGVCARVLATQRREPNVERLFVAGLLHDVGRLILYLRHAEAAAAVFHRCADGGELLYEVEREVMGYDHAAVGRALLREWKLPESLQEPVGYHHQPGRAKRFPAEAAIVHVADIAAHALRLGHSGERHVPPLSEVAWTTLGLREGFTYGMLDDIVRQYEAGVQAMLQAGE